MSDELLFAEDDSPPTEATSPLPTWTLLVVDDDEDVHRMTRLLLRELSFRGRGLTLISAYSASEARTVLAEGHDIGVILLDVVMESDQAGLELARWIREDLRNRAVRIILRTGQPGQAPERRVIAEFDINDYKAKTELTVDRLFTCVIAALRGYSDIMTIEANRKGLRKIIEAADRLMEDVSLRQFAAGVLTQVSALIDAQPNGLVCVESTGPTSFEMLASAGMFTTLPQAQMRAPAARAAGLEPLLDTMDARRSIFGTHYACLYVEGPAGRGFGVYVSAQDPLSDLDRDLLEVFVVKLASSFGNVVLYNQVRLANIELEQRVEARTRELIEANKRLEELATKDALTGAFNRRSFMERIERETARAQVANGRLCVAMLDLDHFKRINDTYGHAAGDAVLIGAVQRLTPLVRPSDLLARFGGEEFVILLSGAGAGEAMIAAERFRAELAASPIRHEETDIPVTVSIGVAELGNGETALELLGRADHALYEAKRSGRNRAVLSIDGGYDVDDETC